MEDSDWPAQLRTLIWVLSVLKLCGTIYYAIHLQYILTYSEVNKQLLVRYLHSNCLSIFNT